MTSTLEQAAAVRRARHSTPGRAAISGRISDQSGGNRPVLGGRRQRHTDHDQRIDLRARRLPPASRMRSSRWSNRSSSTSSPSSSTAAGLPPAAVRRRRRCPEHEAGTSAVARTHGPNAYPRRTVRLVEIRLLEGPNVYRLAPVVKVEVAVGRSPDLAGIADGERRHRPSRPIGARPRLAGPGRRPRRVDPPPPRGPRRARRTGRGPRAVGHGTLGRHVALGRRRAGAPDRRGRVRPGVAQRLARPPDPAHRHPGPDRRPLAGADRRGARDAAVMDPRRRPPDAGDLDHRAPTASRR